MMKRFQIRRSRKYIIRTLLLITLLLEIFCVWSSSDQEGLKLFAKYPASMQYILNNFDKNIFDISSPYYGIVHKNTYGLPSDYKKTSDWFALFTKDLPSWKSFMSQTVHSIQQYELHNPNRNRLLFTSPVSTVTIKQTKDYLVGQEFVAHIQAKNLLNQNKLIGGDYFRAVLINKSTSKGNFRDGIPCSVEDHLNGTYTLRAPLLVPGTYVLEVILCASIELISTYVKWSDERIRQGFLHVATLSSNEKVKCNSDIILYDSYKNGDFCNYSNPRNGEPFFCTRPSSGKCLKIEFVSFQYMWHMGFQEPFNNIPKMTTWYHKDKQIAGSGTVFQVLSRNILIEQNDMMKIKSNSATLRPNGYVHNEQWMSFTHSYQRRTLEDFKKCFSNKVVYLQGDSTMRQFFLLMVEPLELNVTTSQPSSYFHILRTGRNEKLNISLYYRTHGMPFRLDGPPVICPYVTDVIDSLETGGPDVVLIISLGLHYLEYNPAFYIHRLVGIKQAILRHLTKHPETKFIIKGLNVSLDRGYPFEWLVRRYNLLMREILSVKNVVFIDLWDMTSMWPTEGYHPVEKVLLDQANIMFSYFCT